MYAQSLTLKLRATVHLGVRQVGKGAFSPLIGSVRNLLIRGIRVWEITGIALAKPPIRSRVFALGYCGNRNYFVTMQVSFLVVFIGTKTRLV
jgi:hypothetical protein